MIPSTLYLLGLALLTLQDDPVSAFCSPSYFARQDSLSHKHLNARYSIAKLNLSNDVNENTEKESNVLQRRQMLQNILRITAGALVTPSLAPSSAYAEDDELIQVYFGCGCFWHVQHEFVQAEQTFLGRSNQQITARAGYAGGNLLSKDGKVCYHNAAQISDYGSLGHGEVVSLQIPSNQFGVFAKEYCKLFDSNGNRPDQLGDRGLEYRNLVGVPGGVSSKYAKELVQASIESGDKLDFAKGKGTDRDARAVVFVMDTTEHPFYVAEQYHQFHDGFNMGENYPNSYNGLAAQLAKEGTLGVNSCPNGLLGLGALGL